MIVCRTNPQAAKIHQWFEENSKLNTGLVITEKDDPKQREMNKNNQLNFRDTNKPDLLVVNLMLTTGYDVKRLKKMYLLRGPHAQSLLQTISRVNRPYKSPTGKVYKYGYIVDFVDIEKEYDRTIEAYIKELEDDLNENGEDEGSLSGLVIDKEDINRKYQKYVSDLDNIIDTDNLEKFSKRLMQYNKDTLLTIKRLLNGIKECETEFILSNALDYAKQIDSDHNKKLIKTVQDRINFINLSTRSVDTLDYISNKEVVEILFEFIKVSVNIIDLGKLSHNTPEFKRFSETVVEVQNEIKRNKNKDDIKIIKLDELLQKIFNELDIHDLSDLDSITDELLKALQEARNINSENERLASIYGGNFAFVKTYQDSIEKYDQVTKEELEQVLVLIYNNLKDVLARDIVLVQGRKNFVDTAKTRVTKILLKAKLYIKVKQFYNMLLNDLYNNIQIFK